MFSVIPALELRTVKRANDEEFVVTESWRTKTLGRAENFRKPETDFGVSISTNGNVFLLQF
jgi:hypothetical protein